MSVWLYLFLIALCFLIVLLIKLCLIKREIENISERLPTILKSDTNNLVTLVTTDRHLKQFVRILNKSLKELRSLELEYKQGNQALKSSITNISHDLRTPLTAIRGVLCLMEDDCLNSKQVEYLNIIHHKVKELTDLTEQLFDFSKSLEIHQEVKKEKVCMNDILEDSIASFYSLLKEHHLTPTIEMCEEKVFRLLDERMLRRIFDNLISNAIKYSESDLNIKMDSNGVIEFSNQTSQLDVTSVAKIFDRYYTVNNAKKANGIGLSITKQLVHLNGGNIEASYQQNRLRIRLIFS